MLIDDDSCDASPLGVCEGHGAEKVSFSLLVYGLLAIFVPDYSQLSDLVRTMSAEVHSRSLFLTRVGMVSRDSW